MIEWYDFYIFGSLATIISPLFYPSGNDTLALIAYLSTFAVGFVVRPFGALVFGRIGDLVGRKYAFLVTLVLMGGATALVGFLPVYATIGIAAPIALLVIRMVQGLALGGEYGGAAVYVAEHVPDDRRGFYTSFIQITATLGLFCSLVVILLVQNMMSPAAFREWGWRLPFLISILLVGISLYIRLRMNESPIFQHIKSTGMTSAKPLKEAFTEWPNLKPRADLALRRHGRSGRRLVHRPVLCALLPADDPQSERDVGDRYIVAVALLLGMPLFVAMGALSDRIGRKRLMMAGCLLAAMSYVPIYHAMQRAAGSEVVTAVSQRNALTGAISLTPQTMIDGALTPAKEVLPFTGVGELLAESRRQDADRARLPAGRVGDDGLRADRRVSGGGVSGADPLHGDVPAVPHRQRRVRRAAPADRRVRDCPHRQHLRGPLLSDRRCRTHVRRGITAAEGDT